MGEPHSIQASTVRSLHVSFLVSAPATRSVRPRELSPLFLRS
jgi:hypothetical protein